MSSNFERANTPGQGMIWFREEVVPPSDSRSEFAYILVDRFDKTCQNAHGHLHQRLCHLRRGAETANYGRSYLDHGRCALRFRTPADLISAFRMPPPMMLLLLLQPQKAYNVLLNLKNLQIILIKTKQK